MHTMSLAERRRQIVLAIRQLQRLVFPPNPRLLLRLRMELEAIDNGERELKEVSRKTLRWLNRLRSVDEYLAQVLQDPLNEFNKQPSSNNRDIGKRILQLRNRAGGEFTNVSQLSRLGGRADVIIDDLLYTGAVLKPTPPPPVIPPEPDVGVLLPVRLETRFYPPDEDSSEWRMRVLVVPDEASIDRHDPLPYEAELDSVEWLWQNAPGGLNTPEGRTAWQQFAARHGPGRAAWLARSFPPLPPDAEGIIRVPRPGVVRSEPAVSRMRGLPEKLELWMGRGGALPTRVATSIVDSARLSLEFPDPTEPSDQRWWSSWKEAVAAGLGVEITLGADHPGDIDVLYAIGLSEEQTTELFQAHRDQGALGLIEPGTPTNTVDGDPAASLGQDAEVWRQIVLNPASIGWGSQEASQALTGKADTLGPLPGDGFTHRPVAHELIQALWMVLWGHALKDLWGLGEDVYLAGLYAGRFLAPEGPLPTVRVNDEPYGLLPVTPLRDFTPGASDPEFARLEANLLPALREGLELWAQAAEAEGNVSGADTERLLELLGRTPNTNAYAFRYFLSLDLLELLLSLFGGVVDFGAVDDWWRETTDALQRFGVTPTRRYASLGWPQDLQIPLVAPPEVPPETIFREYLSEFFEPEELIEAPPGFWLDVSNMRPYDRLPPSLLARLLLLAKFVAAAEVHRAKDRGRPALEPLGTGEDDLTRLAQDAMDMTNEDLATGGWATELFSQVQHATIQVMERPVGELERVFRSVLDTAAYRLDPWITALAWRRLQESVAAGRPFHLGIYGWVDAPSPGTPGPTGGGLLHAPSETQALAAVILRDKAINDPQADRWEMNLESSTIRLADRIGEEVRLGAHLGEVLGREVERIAGTRAKVQQLRDDFPLRSEHAGRRVCDGLAVLEADSASLPFDAGQLEALEPLRRALDTYGDLLVAEAVYHVVSGRGDVAAAAMDAAAGLGAPPKLESISTRRTGRAVNTNVIVALPPAPDPSEDLHSSPGEIADPAVADFLADELGPANAAPWRWPVLTPGSEVEQVMLSDTGLGIVDTLALSEEDLVRIVLMNAEAGSLLDRGWRVQHADGSVHEMHLSDLGLAFEMIQELTDRDLEQQLLSVAPAGSILLGDLTAEGTLAQRKVRRLASALGRQPAVPADLVDDATTPDDSAVRAELLSRYTRLHNVAGLLQAELAARASGGTEEIRNEALILAARWGVTPVVKVDDTLAERVQRAAEALQERIAHAPLPADIADLDAPRLAAEIAELAAPEGQLAVLGRINLSGWPTAFSAAPELDGEWLATNAAVREPLSRLEGELLERLLAGEDPPFVAWTNRPGDPWQVSVPTSASGAKPATRLISIYGVDGLLPDEPGDPALLPTIAAGLLDSWGETVPDVDQATTAALGFNAPAARSPQAILLAVPPDETTALTTGMLVSAVADARRLARARMATPSDLSRLAAAIPLIMLPGSGVTGVPLD